MAVLGAVVLLAPVLGVWLGLSEWAREMEQMVQDIAWAERARGRLEMRRFDRRA